MDVPETVPEAVPVGEGVTGGVGEAVSVMVVVADDEKDGDGVPLAEPPRVNVVVDDAVIALERLAVVDPLSLPDGVCVGVPELDPVPELVDELVGVALPVPVADTLDESDMLGVNEELAPNVTDGVS